MSLEAEIWAWRLGGGTKEKEKGKKEEKILNMLNHRSSTPTRELPKKPLVKFSERIDNSHLNGEAFHCKTITPIWNLEFWMH